MLFLKNNKLVFLDSQKLGLEYLLFFFFFLVEMKGLGAPQIKELKEG